jgi:hypothetical protein
MKWDKTKNPPEAWFIEDGNWVPVDPKLIKQCKGCDNWLIEDPLKSSDFCNPGCRLKSFENGIKNSKKLKEEF